MQTNKNNFNNQYSNNDYHQDPSIGSRINPRLNEKELSMGDAVRSAFLSQEHPLPAIITEEEISSHSMLERFPEKSLGIKHEFMRLINSTHEEIRKNELLSIGANFLVPGLITGNSSEDFSLDGFTPVRNYKIWGWLLDDLLSDLNPSSKEYQVVKKLKMGISQLEQYTCELEELKGVSDPLALHQMAMRYANNAAKLEPGESLLFHGGWRNKAGGSSHAQVFELTKMENGTYDICIYQSTQDRLASVWLAGNKQRVSPKIVFKGIPENVLLFNDDGVIKPGFIQSLIELRSLAEMDLDRVVDDNEVSRIFSYLHDYYQTPSLNNGGAITGQRSGSCVPSATKAWMRENCEDQNLYKNVLFHLKMKLNIVLYYSLNESLKLQTTEGEIGRRLFKMTAWNLMRHIGKASHQLPESSQISPLWPVQNANATLHHIVKNIEKIEDHLASEKREHTCPSEISSLNPARQRKKRTDIKPATNMKNTEQLFNIPPIPTITPKLNAAGNERIDNLIQLLEKTTHNNKHLLEVCPTNERLSINVQIHQMIDQIPLPGVKGIQFWKAMNQYQPQERVEKLTQIHCLLQTILEQYACTNLYLTDPLTRRFATVFAVHALSRFITIEIEKAKALNTQACLLRNYSTQTFEESLKIDGLIFFDANEKMRIKQAVDYLKKSTIAQPRSTPLFLNENCSTIIKTQVETSPTNGRFWKALLDHNTKLKEAVDLEANQRWPDLSQEEIENDYTEKKKCIYTV